MSNYNGGQQPSGGSGYPPVAGGYPPPQQQQQQQHQQFPFPQQQQQQQQAGGYSAPAASSYNKQQQGSNSYNNNNNFGNASNNGQKLSVDQKIHPSTASGNNAMNGAPQPPNQATLFQPTGRATDVGWAIFFGIFLAIQAVLIGVFAKYINAQPKTSNGTAAAADISSDLRNTLGAGHISAIVVAAIAAPLLSYFYINLMNRFPKQFIKFTFWTSAILSLILSLFLILVTRQLLSGIFGLIMFVLVVVSWFFVRKRIPFAAVLLGYVSNVTKHYPATIFTGIVSTFFAIIFLVAIAFHWATVGKYIESSNDVKQARSIGGAVLLYSVFTMYWFTSVIGNVVHVTVAGLFGTHYFMHNPNATDGNNGMPKNPTAASAKRAVTTSFGSVCFGSFIIAVIMFLRFIVRMAQGDSENIFCTFLGCIVQCILACVQEIIEFINKYAFVQVALYGKPFITSARDTWTLIKNRGIEMLINDNLIGTATGIGALIGAVLTCGVAALVLVIGGVNFSNAGSTEAVIGFIIIAAAFLFGLFTFFIVGGTIDSGVATFFVCIAEDPSILYRNNRMLWDKIRETYPDAAFNGAHA